MAVAIQHARTTKSELMTKETTRAANPLCEGSDQPIEKMALRRQARKDMADHIPKLIDVQVRDTDNTVHSVTVQSAPYARS
eukprot:4673686-Pyramimonas_sp.AAC.1